MKVLLVEDSRAVRAYVEGLLRAEPDIELLPPAMDGAAGVALARSERPDVILMDLDLPVIDGLSAIREIMATEPRPIVVLSARLDASDRDRTFEAFQAGAVDVLSKPEGLGREAVAGFRARLLGAVRRMAQAVVVRRRRGDAPAHAAALAPAPCDPRVVAIGSSTGGPLILYELLEALRPPFPLPIVVSQHILPGFEHGLAAWLGRTGHRAVVARSGDALEPGVIHVAPADRHLAVRAAHLELLPGAEGAPTPSVDVLFGSIAASFGAAAIALLLSGMGDDGARGMLALRSRGALTATQSGETCVVDGMPAAARAIGASQYELSPREIADLLKGIRRPGVP